MRELTGLQGLTLMAIISIALVAGMCFGVELQSSAGKRLEEKPRRRKTSNVVLLVLGLSAALFITVMTVIFCVKGAVPDTLITCFFGGGGVEALLLAGIKISKVRAGGTSGEGEDIYE